MTTELVMGILGKVEDFIDANPMLTRYYPSKTLAEAEVVITKSGFVVQIKCRGTQAKGRGAKLMGTVSGFGDTVEEAYADFVKNAPYAEKVYNE